MRMFIKKIIFLVLAIAVCLGFVMVFHCIVISHQYANSYGASLIDKVDRLMSIHTPKIILVGNSNLSFGIHSDAIEEALGYPVVNLGLHGGLGNAFHERIAQLNINEGDIVVVCHSSYDNIDMNHDPLMAWTVFDWNWQLFPLYTLRNYGTMLIGYPAYFRAALKLWIMQTGNGIYDNCYSRTAFNEYGDVVYKPDSQQVDVDTFFSDNPIFLPTINRTCINRLNQLDKYCNDRGAALVVAGYPIAYGQYTKFSEHDLDEFQVQLKEQLNCEVISDYTEYLYPYEYFYNTKLHLNDKGTEARTQQLISDLKAWLAQR